MYKKGGTHKNALLVVVFYRIPSPWLNLLTTISNKHLCIERTPTSLWWATCWSLSTSTWCWARWTASNRGSGSQSSEFSGKLRCQFSVARSFERFCQWRQFSSVLRCWWSLNDLWISLYNEKRLSNPVLVKLSLFVQGAQTAVPLLDLF